MYVYYKKSSSSSSNFGFFRPPRDVPKQFQSLLFLFFLSIVRYRGEKKEGVRSSSFCLRLRVSVVSTKERKEKREKGLVFSLFSLLF